jgi:flagellar biosynthetic protein FlhB
MTKGEVKDEHKQAEGDPLIKSMQRQKMLKSMQKRMLESVPKADVVITNPTHLAIALRYNPLEAPSPVVLAKGANFMAEKIKDLAREHKIPLRENKPLAQALYKSVDVGEMIPEELYQAVAAVLAQLPKFRRRT